MTTERNMFFKYLDVMEHQYQFITFGYLDPVDFNSNVRYGTEEEMKVISDEANSRSLSQQAPFCHYSMIGALKLPDP